MYPVLFRIGGFSIYAYGVLLALAFAAGTWGLAREGKRAGFPEEKLLDMCMWILVAAIIGSRFLYILLDLPRYLAEPLSVFQIRSGGLSFHGGLLAGIGAGLYFLRRHKLPQGKIADLAAPYLVLGYAIVRVGCLLNGCCFGRPSGGSWALPAAYADNTLRHPTQLYAFAAAMLIFVILWLRKGKVRFHGQLFLEFLALYSVYRFAIEFFRETSIYSGFLTLGQAVSLIGAVFAIVAICVWPLGRRHRS
jgi:phosphatidylglycerol---prolipoprotein diacylglyceryl transferase